MVLPKTNSVAMDLQIVWEGSAGQESACVAQGEGAILGIINRLKIVRKGTMRNDLVGRHATPQRMYD